MVHRRVPSDAVLIRGVRSGTCFWTSERRSGLLHIEP